MALFKLGDKIWSLGDDIHLLAELDYMPVDGQQSPLVRFQSRNRRDEVTVVAGKPIHIKHGVYELSPELSDKFRWFIDIMGPNIGIIDADLMYTNRVKIDQELEDAKVLAAGKRVGPKLLQMTLKEPPSEAQPERYPKD